MLQVAVMSLSLRSLSPKLLLPLAALCLAGPARAEPRLEDERAEIMRQLNESRERVKKLEERLRQVEARRTQSAAVTVARLESTCSMPLFLDAEGVKHFRPECLAAAAARVPCDVNPFTIDGHGIKRIRPACGGDNSMSIPDVSAH
jgi:hypothetical protein